MPTNIEQAFSLLPMIALIFGSIGFATVMFVVPVILKRLAPVAGHRRELHQTHKAPIPRLGGIALAAAFILSGLAAYGIEDYQPTLPHIVLGLTALAMFGLGLWDDFSPIGARKKLLGQILIASVAFWCGLKVDMLKNPITGTIYSLGSFSAVATVFWLVAMTNLINLIDGIDGLAAGIGLMLMCLLAYVSMNGAGNVFSLVITMGMSGALIAFLYFNFPPAKIYLGDGGAYLLGYLIGGLAIQNSNKGTIAAALIAPILALALPILDVSFSIVRRGLKGLPIFRPDRRHIHHRLIQAGWSRRRAVLTLYAISALFLALAFVAFWSGGRFTPILVGCVFVVLLLVAPSLGLIKNWLTIGTSFGNSLEMRKEIQYALLLRNWMALESDRSDSLALLWKDFTFAAGKLGFTGIMLTHRATRCSWTADSTPEVQRTARHELNIGDETVVLETWAPDAMEDKLFQLKSELAAETWQHAARRWSERKAQTFALPASVRPDLAPADVFLGVEDSTPAL